MSKTRDRLFGAAYALFVLFILLLASVPPVSRDAMTHHLAIPRLWLEQGMLAEIPEIAFSYYPQLLDLLYVIPLYLGNDIAAKYIHFAFALLTAGLIFAFVRRRSSTAWGALAGLMFLTIPVIIKLSITVYVDLGLVFFTTAALFSLVLWFEDSQQIKWLLLAAVCSGLALSTKYNAIVSFLVLAMLLPMFFLKNQADKKTQQLNAFKYGVIFVAVSLLVFSPWMLRNATLTGNPVYPLMQGVFSTDISTAKADEAASIVHARSVIADDSGNSGKAMGVLLARKLIFDESLPYTLLIPLRVFYEGQDDNPKYFDGRLNLLLLLLPLALLYLARQGNFRAPEIPWLASYSVLLLLLTFFTTDMRARYIATIIPPLIVLSVYSLYLLHGRLRTSTMAANLVVIALCTIFFLPNLSYARDLYKKVDPMSYLTGKVSRDEYILKRRPVYGITQKANEVVPENGKVLGLYLGNRRYYFLVDTMLYTNVFTHVSENAATADAMASQLSELGYTHLAMNNTLFKQWLERSTPELQQRVLQFSGTHLRTVMDDSGYSLYEIRR